MTERPLHAATTGGLGVEEGRCCRRASLVFVSRRGGVWRGAAHRGGVGGPGTGWRGAAARWAGGRPWPRAGTAASRPPPPAAGNRRHHATSGGAPLPGWWRVTV